MNATRKIASANNVLLGLRRNAHSNAELIENAAELVNRNPRNLELLRIARKPNGYSLEKPGRKFWHKLVVQRKPRYVKAQIVHFEKGPLIMVSTNEWGLKQQLYSTQDMSAYFNLARVLAQRCLETGIYEVYCDVDTANSKKLTAFIEELKSSGLSLQEPANYRHANPWDWFREEKPWEVHE